MDIGLGGSHQFTPSQVVPKGAWAFAYRLLPSRSLCNLSNSLCLGSSKLGSMSCRDTNQKYRRAERRQTDRDRQKHTFFYVFIQTDRRTGRHVLSSVPDASRGEAMVQISNTPLSSIIYEVHRSLSVCSSDVMSSFMMSIQQLSI